MTYTIRDNNGNVVFSIENTTPTTPEVSFESVNAEFDKLEAYSNKLSKSIEAFNLISDTRAMEALGYVKGAGFGKNIKNIGKYIWKKIKEKCLKLVEIITSAFRKIKEAFGNLGNELSIKNNIISFLRSNKFNEPFNKSMNAKSKETYKKILKIYENETTRSYICYCVDHPEIINNISEIIDHLNKFDPDDYTKLVDDYISSNKVNKELLTKVNTRYNNGREILEKYSTNVQESTAELDIKTFSTKLIKFMSLDKYNSKTLHDYEFNIEYELKDNMKSSWIPKIDKIINKIENYQKTLDKKETAEDSQGNVDSNSELNNISNSATYEMNTISDLMNLVSLMVFQHLKNYHALINLLGTEEVK